MHGLDEWHDYLRLLNLIISAACIFMLWNRFRKSCKDWTAKTKDYWLALVFWSITGVAASLEGILRDAEVGTRLVFVLTASTITFIGLRRKGPWGQ